MDLLSSSAPDNQALSTTIAASPTPYPTSDALQLTPPRPASSLVFIDSAVADGQFLAANVTAGSEVHFLDPTQDAIAQITNTLLGREGIASIHIVSHGEAGGLDFGSGQLNLSDLPEFTSQIQSWKTALTDDGDILLYGCDVAKGELGQAFVQILSQLTGADVAASNDLTGSEALDGNWNLEFNTGKIESAEVFQFPSNSAYHHTLATFTVTNTSDSGAGSLRQAILDANASTGADTITFAGPTFTDGTPDVIRLASELFVNDDLTIQGTGINNLTISGDANNSGSNDAGDVRVFFVNTGTVILQNLSIANGRAQGGDGGAGVGGGGGGAGLGGGLLINDANVTLQNVAFSNNQAIGGAGASGSANTSFSGGGGGGIGGAGGSATGYDFDGYGGVGGNGGNFGGAGGAGNTGGLGGGDGGMGAGGGGGDLAMTPDQEQIGPGSGGAGGFGGGGGGLALFYGLVGGRGGFGGGAGGGAGNDGGDSGGSNGGTFGGGWSNNSNADNTGFDGGGGAGLGGAIFIRSGSLTLNTITFTGNSATGGAGRIYSGQGKGGAIFVLDSLTNANGNNQGMPTTLPTVLASGVTFASNNATDNVSSTTPTGGIGSNQDNEDVYGTIAFGSNAPVVTVANNALAYTENGAPILLDPGATVTDTDSADFAGGTLTVQFASGGIASDRLTIQSGGSVTLDGTKVLISGTQIGTYSGGFGTDNLVISLNSAANATTVQTLLRAIAYSSTDERLSTTATNRTVEVTLTDGDGGTSTAVTKNVTVTGVNDAPIVGDRRVLYDGSLNTTPAAQGWVAVTTGSVETTSGGATTLNSTASLNLYAGYTRTSPIALDATQGYVLSFQAQVNAENRNATLGTGADKNGDGKFDRAGFSLLVVSSDNTRALELGFNLIGTNLQIWVQEDGTSQSNPSTQAGSVGDTNLLFTQAEGVTIANPGMGSYDVAVQGNTYTLFLNGTAILSGKLRNYTAATGPIDPYETPNLIFFGDDTTSASGSFSLASVGVTVAGNIPDQTTLEDAAATLIPFGAFDLESYTLPSLSATDDPTLVANATFGGTGIARTLSLTPTVNAFGTTTIQLDGSDGALTATDTFNVTILAVNDQPDTTPGANQTVTSGAGAQTVANWATFTPGPANESDQTATYTIVSNDTPGLFSVAPAIDASGNLTYTPAVGIATAQTATLTYRVQDNGGTANGGVDLSDVRSFTITINPPTIGLTAPDATAAESGTDTGTFQISRGSVTGGDLVVNLTIAGTSTASTADYTFSNNVSVSGSNLTVTIPDGQSFVDVVLTPILDAVVEGTETLTLNLATGSYGINSAQATVSVDITDAPVLSITAPDATATELPGNLGTYRITRTGDTSQDLVVNYTIGGTATNSTDYAPLTGTTTIAAGQSFVDVSLAPVNDNLVEGSETVVLTLAAGDYGISATDTATVDILDAPVLSVAATDATASELPGNSGSYRITRTGDTSQDLVVNYTMSGTATSGSDYTALTGIATIATGQSFVDVTLTPINDTLVEGTETATLSVSANSTYNIDTAQNTASVDILDAPIVSVTAPDATATELSGDAGTFRITRVGDTTSALIVNYTVGGTATSGSDYTPLTGTATIAAGQSFVDVTLAPVNDTSVEGIETVILTLASGDYAISAPNTATVDISDAAIVSVSVPNASASESTPNSGSFRLTRTGDTSQALTVNYTIAGTATNGTDYTTLSGIATITAGQTFVDVLVNPINDTIAEGDETIQLSLATGDYNLGSSTSGNVTILANDPTIRITPVIVSQSEGDSGISNSIFTVELSNPSDEVVTVNYATADGTATTADNDYIANAGTLIFNPSVTSQTITIAVNGDTTFEADETFQVNLSAATNGTLSTLAQTATGLIGNDDALPVYTFSTANYRALEGDGPNVIPLAMTRTGNLSQAASVQVQLSNGSAIAGRDFVGGVITVSFAAGQSVAYLPVQILGNRQPESDKTLNLSLVGLSEPGNYGEQTQASLTIINDDPLSHTIFRKGKGRSGIKVKKPKHRKLKRRK